MTDEFVTVKQAAIIKGVTPYTVRRWIAQGKLPAGREPIIGWAWMILRADLDKVEPGRAGRPKVEKEGERRKDERSRRLRMVRKNNLKKAYGADQEQNKRPSTRIVDQEGCSRDSKGN